MSENAENALTRATTIRDLVAAFRNAETTVRRCFADLVAAEGRLNDVFTLGGNLPVRIDASRNGYHDSFDDADHCVNRMARQAWSHLVDRLELRRMMSIKRWAELEKQLKDGELPAITEENVANFAQEYLSALPDMLTEAVAEVFEWLRPRNSDYKTNSELEVGSKVVLRWMVDRAWSGGGFRVNYHRDQHLSALENVFHALDGKGQISKAHYSELHTAIEKSGASGRGETSLFRFRAFKNRNMHLEFKRLDLLARFNAIAGGMRLRPAAVA